MFQIGKIKIRNINELQDNAVGLQKKCLTPLRKRKNILPDTTFKKLKDKECASETVIDNNIGSTTTKIAKKTLLKSALKEPPSNQKLIDSYFTCCPKNYNIKLPKEDIPTPIAKSRTQSTKTKARGSQNTSTTKKSNKFPGRTKARRKRLFTDSTEPSTKNMSDTKYGNQNNIEYITINSDSEQEINVKKEIFSSNDQLNSISKLVQSAYKSDCSMPLRNSLHISAPSLSFGQRNSKTSCEKSNSNISGRVSKRKTKPCPPYKIIESTTFAVDAFQFGYIDKVTHYFLTHFHADHYIGLTKSFSMPLVVSPITARLLHAFIPIQEQYIIELDIHQSCVINNIEITALDANHCPGSVMFVFKFLDTGKCILHTGDFRACHDMESEQIFWNNSIHTIYLDTTYISDKYAFCTQYESIEKTHDLIDEFLLKHNCRRVLYICGSYIIGKEKFWSSLAIKNDMKVWTEGNRYKALKAINDENFNRLLVEDPNEANLHILPMGKLRYLELVEYFKLYEHKYDVLFAIRPSGWEKNTKPRYGSKINLVGVEYSEHSSYAEMKRFVKYLKPEQVISTVPTGKDLMKTSNVPHDWYKYDKLKVSSNYQPTLHSFMAKTPQKESIIRYPNADKGGVDYLVSPLPMKKTNSSNKNIVKTITVNSSLLPLLHENIEHLGRGISPENFGNCRSLSKIKMQTFSISNSSEDFENPNFITQKNKIHRNTNDFNEKEYKTSLAQTKPKRNNKQLTPNQISIQTFKINSEELIEVPENNFIPSNLDEQNSNNSSTRQRKSRFQRNNSSKSTNKTNQNDESFKSTSQNKLSINTTTTTHLELEGPISHKRVTRSRTISKPKTQKYNNGNELESNLLKATVNNAIQSPGNLKSHLKSSTNFNKYEENLILKSKTSSSTDQTSIVRKLYNQSTISQSKINSLVNADNRVDKCEELPTKSCKNKTSALNHNSVPFEKTKSLFNTQTILNDILEQSEGFDRFNCSQLGGLVVETANLQNPDNNNDHIPVDLLSDADDDWM